jgi:tRNA threonylcarbamoyladenosine modification (KEOPS) complex  Pcc1 subunit
VVTKKSEAWLATITTSSPHHAALAASLACEEVQYDLGKSNSIQVVIHGGSASDLRAKFNSTMRSLRAASEALSSIQ